MLFSAFAAIFTIHEKYFIFLLNAIVSFSSLF